jgi:hypothetical protein
MFRVWERSQVSIFLTKNEEVLTSCTRIHHPQLTCRGAPCGYPRIEELALLTVGARCESTNPTHRQGVVDDEWRELGIPTTAKSLFPECS